MVYCRKHKFDPHFMVTIECLQYTLLLEIKDEISYKKKFFTEENVLNNVVNFFMFPAKNFCKKKVRFQKSLFNSKLV